jgi:hypothetical protein
MEKINHVITNIKPLDERANLGIDYSWPLHVCEITSNGPLGLTSPR